MHNLPTLNHAPMSTRFDHYSAAPTDLEIGNFATSRYMEKRDNPNELFVGNLSFFCDEQDLYSLVAHALFGPNSTLSSIPPEYFINRIGSIRIIRSEKDPTRSLLFGFVSMVNHADCYTVVKRLHGTLFMGRRLKSV